MRHYYIEFEGKEIGPLTKQELQDRRLTKTSLIWFEGLDNWTEAKNIEDLKEIVFAAPPPLPSYTQTKSNNITKAVKEVPQKYDEKYDKETDATAAGVAILIILFLFYVTGGLKIYDQESYSIFYVILTLISLIFRIATTDWIIKIAKRQNRNTMGWGIFAFFIPVFALIIIGQTKKLYDPNEKPKGYVSVRENKYEDFLNGRGQ